MSPSKPAAATPSVLSLEQQICYAMHTTVRAFDAVYRELLSEHGLSYPQYIALMTVGEHGPLTVGRLGELMRPRLRHPLAPAQAHGGGRPRRTCARPRGRAARARLGDHGRPGPARRPRRRAAPDRARSGLSRQELLDLHRTLRQVTERLDTAPDLGAGLRGWRDRWCGARWGDHPTGRRTIRHLTGGARAQEGSTIETAWMSMPMRPPTRVPLMRMNCRSRPTWSSTRSAVSLPSHRSTVSLMMRVSSVP